MHHYSCRWLGPGGRGVGATGESEHTCAIHMIGKVPVWLERILPVHSLPTGVESLRVTPRGTHHVATCDAGVGGVCVCVCATWTCPAPVSFIVTFSLMGVMPMYSLFFTLSSLF